MKKILLLGGSAQQIIAIETARRLGFYTVLCDYLTDNPGQYHADKFYLVSTTDKEAILQVAQQENVDGVLAYASDPAAPTAAYVAEKMGLPGNPTEAVETLCNKDRFRVFLRENGFNAPCSGGYADGEAAIRDFGRFRLPVIVKPVDSSGSKGATVLRDQGQLPEALDFAFSFSRSHRIIIEEFIEKDHPYLIGGDLFVEDGRIVLWGLLNCHRDPKVNPLVPVGKSYPLELKEEYACSVRRTLQELVDKLHLRSGAMNVELVVDASGRVWPIDIGPRNGGNMIPDLLGMIFGVDVVEMSVLAAMGEAVSCRPKEGSLFYATHNLHSAENGSFEQVTYSEAVRPYLVRECVYKKTGDAVQYFDNASKAVGIVFLHFDGEKSMKKILTDINSHIGVTVVKE